MRRRRTERERLYRSAAYRDTTECLASSVRRLRHERGWTQEVAAANCGIDTRLLQAIEASDANITLITLARLAKGFGVKPGELFVSR